MNKLTKFFLGFGISILIVFIYFIVYIFNNKTVVLDSFIIFPLFAYLAAALVSKGNSMLYKNDISLILKIVAVFFFCVIYLSLLINGLDVSDSWILIIAISIFFNWTIETENSSRITTPVKKKKKKIYYFINFIVLFFMHVLISLVFFNRAESLDDCLMLIFVHIGSFIFLYWILYLIYRFILKISLFSIIFKCFLVLMALFIIYYNKNSISDYRTILFVCNLVGIISVTAQNLILS